MYLYWVLNSYCFRQHFKRGETWVKLKVKYKYFNKPQCKIQNIEVSTRSPLKMPCTNTSKRMPIRMISCSSISKLSQSRLLGIVMCLVHHFLLTIKDKNTRKRARTIQMCKPHFIIIPIKFRPKDQKDTKSLKVSDNLMTSKAILRGTIILQIHFSRRDSQQIKIRWMKIHFLCNKSPVGRISKHPIFNSNSRDLVKIKEAYRQQTFSKASRWLMRTTRGRTHTAVWNQNSPREMWNAIRTVSLRISKSSFSITVHTRKVKSLIIICKDFNQAATTGGESRYLPFSRSIIRDRAKHSLALKFKGRVKTICSLLKWVAKDTTLATWPTKILFHLPKFQLPQAQAI